MVRPLVLILFKVLEVSENDMKPVVKNGWFCFWGVSNKNH